MKKGWLYTLFALVFVGLPTFSFGLPPGDDITKEIERFGEKAQLQESRWKTQSGDEVVLKGGEANLGVVAHLSQEKENRVGMILGEILGARDFESLEAEGLLLDIETKTLFLQGGGVYYRLGHLESPGSLQIEAGREDFSLVRVAWVEESGAQGEVEVLELDQEGWSPLRLKIKWGGETLELTRVE